MQYIMPFKNETTISIVLLLLSLQLKTCTGPPDECIDGTGVTNVNIIERKSRKEQLKCLVYLLDDILQVWREEKGKLEK